MTTKAITPLRQRMIEDMNARKLCAGTQRGHIRSCKRFAAFLKRSPETATFEDIRRFQLHLAETGVSIYTRNITMTGLRFLFRVTLRRLDLAAEIYHIREPQDSAGHKRGRDATAAGRCRQSQGPHHAQSRLWLRPARRRGGKAEGQAYRQRPEDHSGRTVQGSQGPQRHAVAGDARSVAPMVESAPAARQCRNACGGTLAVSRQDARPANDHPPAEPSVSRDGRGGRDQEERNAACAAPQLRDPPA